MKPVPTNFCTEADIARLRMCRNKLMHSDKLRLPDAELQVKWKELSAILSRLNQKAGIADLQKMIDGAEHMDVDEDLRNEHNETLKAWEEKDKKVDQEIGELKSAVSDVNHKVSDVQHNMIGIKRQLVDAQQTKTKHQRAEELKDIQSDIIEKYKYHFNTLPVSPVFEDIDDDLLHVYQSPTMKSEEPSKKESKQINSYEDVFCMDGKICKHIYITGDAGVGKTSFCRRLCLLWYMAKCSVAVGDEALKKDVDYISKFDFVFYITLRDTRRTHVLYMIIDQFFESIEKYEHTVKRILRDEQCLVLLDGMDEWSPENVGVRKYKCPEKVYSENCVYLTTCRPYRLESDRLSHKKDIDHQIKMTGISGGSSKCYVQKLVDYMNQLKSCNRKSFDFEQEVTKCGLNQQLCIPIITSHLVVLWYERSLTGMSMAAIYGNIMETLFERAEQREIQFPPSTTSSYQLPDSLSGLRYMREREKLLHKFEVDAHNSRQADVKKCVKEYRRPTVGKQDVEPGEVRPPKVLVQTTLYLIDKVTAARCEWSDIYDFMFDRLRSIRQDIVVQDVHDTNTVGILERAVRFHIYSDYRLCMAHMAVFDPKINTQHTQECLKRLINLYNDIGTDAWRNRIEMETIYLLFNLGDLDAIRHYYTLPHQLRHSEEIKLAYNLSCACLHNNWRKVFRSLSMFKSPIYLCAVHRHFPILQRNALQIMNTAYSSKNSKFPLEKITLLLGLNTDTESQTLCQQFSVTVDGTNAHFLKANFKLEEKVKRNHSDCINSVLKQYTIPQILHGNKHINSDLSEKFSDLCRT